MSVFNWLRLAKGASVPRIGLSNRELVVLVTSETQETIPKDLSVWKDKCIFYSPRIETGVDFSIDTSQSVFFHMKGDSLGPATCVPTQLADLAVLCE